MLEGMKYVKTIIYKERTRAIKNNNYLKLVSDKAIPYTDEVKCHFIRLTGYTKINSGRTSEKELSLEEKIARLEGKNQLQRGECIILKAYTFRGRKKGARQI